MYVNARLHADTQSSGMQTPSHVLRNSAWAGAALVLAMISMYFLTGVGQDPLQFFHLPEEYASFLLKNPGALRTVITLDDLFVVAYTVMFLCLFAELRERGAPRVFVYLGVTCTTLLAALDMIENFHFMTMLSAAEQGVLPSLARIQFQVHESLLKFHTGYLGTFLVGLALPRARSAERALAFACCWVSLPVGVLIYALPAPWNTVFLFGRFGFFMYALISIGWLFGPARASQRDGHVTGVPSAASDSSALV
jgi:hypothetical protein